MANYLKDTNDCLMIGNTELELIFVHSSLIAKTAATRLSKEARLIDEADNMDEALDLFNDYFSGSRSVPALIFLNLNLTSRETQLLLGPFETLKLEDQRLIIMASVSEVLDNEREALQKRSITYFDQHSDITKAELLSNYFQFPNPSMAHDTE